MSGLINKFFNGGLEDERYDDDVYDQYDDNYEDDYDEYEEAPSYESRNNIININGDEKATVIVIEPKTMQDACAIIQILKENKICVGKFDLTNSSEVQNIVDFISGAVYALNADMEKISDEIFIVAPANVEIKKTVTEEARQSGGAFSFRKR